MNPYYNQNYTKEQITDVLQTIQDCIREDRFIISMNEKRQDNINFEAEYNLNSRKKKEILLKIKTEDFCHTLQNTKAGFEYETLYVFCLQEKLFNFQDKEEQVDIYTKFNIINYHNGKRVVVISLHKLKKPIDYAFK